MNSKEQQQIIESEDNKPLNLESNSERLLNNESKTPFPRLKLSSYESNE